MFSPKKILVLAPHTDDGELGCGGTIAKFRNENVEVHYAAFSVCKKSLPPEFTEDTLEKECKRAIQKLGMHTGKLMLYDFEVREFWQKRQEILEELVSLKKYILPDLVFVPSITDIHQDHRVVHEEAVRAFKHSTILGYELPWNQTDFSAKAFIKISEKELNQKIEALNEYRSQANRSYMDKDFIRSLAKVRGVQCNSEYAEAFEVIKLIG
jgi:N-acetylglucosamine malate deacetylase 1